MRQEDINAQTWLARARQEEEDERPEAALAAVDKALEGDPSLSEAWRLKASLHLDLEQEEQALQTLDLATQRLPQDAGCWFDRGAALVTSDPAAAAQCFAHARQLQPDMPRLAANLGIALLRAGQAEEAVGPLEAAVRESPDEAHLWCRLGEAALGAHRCQRAVECFDRCLALAGDDYVSLGNRALAMCHLSRPEPALKSLQRALELAPDQPRLWAIKGLALEQSLQHDEALEAFDRSLQLDPRDPDTWTHKAQHLFNRGQNEEASRCRRQALLLSGRLRAWGLCLLDEQGNQVPGSELRCESDLPPEAIAHRYLTTMAEQGHAVDEQGRVDGRFQAALWEIPAAETPA